MSKICPKLTVIFLAKKTTYSPLWFLHFWQNFLFFSKIFTTSVFLQVPTLRKKNILNMAYPVKKLEWLDSYAQVPQSWDYRYMRTANNVNNIVALNKKLNPYWRRYEQRPDGLLDRAQGVAKYQRILAVNEANSHVNWDNWDTRTLYRRWHRYNDHFKRTHRKSWGGDRTSTRPPSRRSHSRSMTPRRQRRVQRKLRRYGRKGNLRWDSTSLPYRDKVLEIGADPDKRWSMGSLLSPDKDGLVMKSESQVSDAPSVMSYLPGSAMPSRQPSRGSSPDASSSGIFGHVPRFGNKGRYNYVPDVNAARRAALKDLERAKVMKEYKRRLKSVKRRLNKKRSKSSSK